MNKDILEQINLEQLKTLVEIAIKAKDKFQNRGYWITNFNRALEGIQARIFGLKNHYANLQSIDEGGIISDGHRMYNFIELDHHLSDILFNLDSAIECLVFALNAIGYGIMDSNLFISIEDEKRLRRIKPDNIFNGNNEHYKKYFPNLTNYWLENPLHKYHITPKQLWESIRDNHDVSKHRLALCRMASGSDNETDIYLNKYPKKPLIEEVEFEPFYPWSLIDHLKEFVPFFNKSLNFVIQDLEKFLQQSN